MASFAAEQHHVARLQGLTSGRKAVGVGICGGVGGGFVSREADLLSGGCRRFGISGVSGDRSQYCDVAFAAQQGPHAVALHADLDFVSFGEHRFDLLEKQTAPNGGEEGSENDDKAKVDAIVGLYNSTKSQNGGKK